MSVAWFYRIDYDLNKCHCQVDSCCNAPVLTNSTRIFYWCVQHVPEVVLEQLLIHRAISENDINRLYRKFNHRKKMHILKTVDPHFTQVWRGKKNFEVRKDDRGFEIEDDLTLCEYNPQTQMYNRQVICTISAKLTHQDHPGIQEGYCVLGLADCVYLSSHRPYKQEENK